MIRLVFETVFSLPDRIAQIDYMRKILSRFSPQISGDGKKIGFSG
jgi:hypothetical protein